MTATMPSMRQLMVGPDEPVTICSVSVGMGIYETDSASGQTPTSYNEAPPQHQQQHQQYNAAPYDSYEHQEQQQPEQPYEQRPTLLNEASDDTNFLPDAPYRAMLSQYGTEDPTVERARSIMASHQGQRQAGRPSAKAGVPQESTAQAVEPAVPASRLGRRCLTHRPKRQPDLVRGKVLQHPSNNTNPTLAHVECISCGVTLEISKNAIVVNCPSCSQVHHTATCRIRISSHH
jgi:predicted RNA-binding Zn-ribbon protein involved in translation (DUF1610 family)